MDSSEVEIKDEKLYYCALCQVSFGCQKAWDSYVHEDCKFYHMSKKKTKNAKKKAKILGKQKNHSDRNRDEIRSEIQNVPNKNRASFMDVPKVVCLNNSYYRQSQIVLHIESI